MMMENKNLIPFLGLLIVLFTIAAFWQIKELEFINFDDPGYVVQNSHIRTGFNKNSIVWAFTNTSESLWLPLTWLSHMLDFRICGLNPAGHHTTNLILHILNTILLFSLLQGMTGAVWRSAFVAALFAVHPLHVEPVAWVSDRKGLLSGLFWMLTLAAYVRYTKRPGVKRYMMAVLFYIPALLSKPMVVTLPFVLLLLDFWPLERFGKIAPRRLILEKIPFFVLAATLSIITILVVDNSTALLTLETLPLDLRIGNALTSYIFFIGKTFLPHGMAFYYPFPTELPWWQAAGAGLALSLILILVMTRARTHPYLLMGYLWYLGVPVPAMGLIKNEMHTVSDRYFYISIVGLFIIVAWGIPVLLRNGRFKRIALAISAGASLSALALCTWTQVGYWRNDFTLNEHALKVTRNNYVAHNNLGMALARQGKEKEALSHFYKALDIHPDDLWHYNLGYTLCKLEKYDEAFGIFSELLRRTLKKPDTKKRLITIVEVNTGLGMALAGQGRYDEAIRHFKEALRLQPGFAPARHFLKLTLEEKRRK